MRNILITCDTEALEFPIRTDSINRNILGYSEKDNLFFGIESMMHAADKVNAKIIFFYDVFTEFSSPGVNKKIADLILSNGHDFQLHAHIEHLDDAWWSHRGYKKPSWATNYFDDKSASLILEEACSLYFDCVGNFPNAYRAGSWRFNSSLLKAMKMFHVMASFNYYPATTIRSHYPHGVDAGILDKFRWANGVVEFPTGIIYGPNIFSSTQKYFGFETHSFEDVINYKNFIKAHEVQFPLIENVVMVMHSWNFLDSKNGVFQEFNYKKYDSFVKFLDWAVQHHKFENRCVRDLLSSTSDALIEHVPVQFAGNGHSKLANL
jgi:hypothetical protein